MTAFGEGLCPPPPSPSGVGANASLFTSWWIWSPAAEGGSVALLQSSFFPPQHSKNLFLGRCEDFGVPALVRLRLFTSGSQTDYQINGSPWSIPVYGIGSIYGFRNEKRIDSLSLYFILPPRHPQKSSNSCALIRQKNENSFCIHLNILNNVLLVIIHQIKAYSLSIIFNEITYKKKKQSSKSWWETVQALLRCHWSLSVLLISMKINFPFILVL